MAEEYLGFSRKERTGIISLLLIILFIYLIPVIYSRFRPPQPVVTARVLAYIDSTLPEHPTQPEVTFPGTKVSELFDFDPNTLSLEGWTRLGLPPRVARTIENYRKKGGRFYQPADLQKIWGLPPGFYESVKAHISIPPRETQVWKNERFPPPTREIEKKEKKILDINQADSSAWIALPWIGEKLAGRILAFREKLGGFYSVDQVGETYGLPDSNFQKIKPLIRVDAGGIRKFNLNTATKEELKSHPYIKWNLANAIVNYREQHGPFTSLDDLKKIALVDEGLYEKIRHYFSLQ